MTTRELLSLVGQSPALAATVLLAPSLMAILLGWLHPRGAGKRSPYKYGYSLAVYVACTFGVLALLLDSYTLLFTRENLLDTNALVTIAPVVAMVLALGLVSRQVKFHELPGFGRLSGLLMMLAASFVGVFVLSKTHFAVLFHGSVWTLLMIAAALFAALKLGAHLAFRR
jgi:hypothetical protein